MNIPGIPEQYDLVRIGYPKKGELYLYAEGIVQEWIDPEGCRTITPVAIVRLVARWSKLKANQWDGKPRVARLRQSNYDPWYYDTVVDYIPGARWKTASGRFFRQCEVYGNEQNS